MRTIFYLFACTSVISGLAASAVNFPLRNENESEEDFKNLFAINDHLEIFYPEAGNAESLIIPYPTGTPTTTTEEPTTTTEFTTITTEPTTTEEPTTATEFTTITTEPTTTEEPTTTPEFTTIPTEPTTSTRRPSTPRPTPPKPNPNLNNVQIYNNAVRSLEPFASRLVNIVLNKKGRQETVQENRILYNFRIQTERTGL